MQSLMQKRYGLIKMLICEQVGDNVLLQNTKKLSRKGSKYEQSWRGPYEIAERAGKGRYYVRKQNECYM